MISDICRQAKKMAASFGKPVSKDQKSSNSFSKKPTSKHVISFELVKEKLLNE